nr:SH3 domain-containing protein [bacterium]
MKRKCVLIWIWIMGMMMLCLGCTTSFVGNETASPTPPDVDVLATPPSIWQQATPTPEMAVTQTPVQTPIGQASPLPPATISPDRNPIARRYAIVAPGNRLFIRSSPEENGDGNLIGQLYRNDAVDIVAFDEPAGWNLVRLADGQLGYCKAEYLSPVIGQDKIGQKLEKSTTQDDLYMEFELLDSIFRHLDLCINSYKTKEGKNRFDIYLCDRECVIRTQLPLTCEYVSRVYVADVCVYENKKGEKRIFCNVVFERISWNNRGYLLGSNDGGASYALLDISDECMNALAEAGVIARPNSSGYWPSDIQAEWVPVLQELEEKSPPTIPIW